MITGQFIERFGTEETVILTPAERELKRKMLRCFTTQQTILKEFSVQHELFRPAPLYDFSEPPHPGPLLYERWGWGISGDTWRRRAREAQRV